MQRIFLSDSTRVCVCVMVVYCAFVEPCACLSNFAALEASRGLEKTPSILFVHFLCKVDLPGFAIFPLQLARQEGSWCVSKHRRFDESTFFLVRAFRFFQTASRQKRECVFVYSCPHVSPVKPSRIFGCHAREGPGRCNTGLYLRVFLVTSTCA